jgi:hypothetical protein
MLVDEEGNYAKRKLEDGRTLYVIPLTYGRARLCIGNKYEPYIFDDGF